MSNEWFTSNHISVEESELEMSDGVRLKLYDFRPEIYSESDPVLIFVAGWVSLISGWQDVLKVITPVFRVLYVETREKKSASMPSGDYPEFTIDRMALDISEIISNTIPESTPFYLAGSSLGSTVILDYLGTPEYRMPEKAILISPIASVDFPFWGKLIINYFPPSAYTVIKHIVIWYLNTFRVDRKKEPEQAEKYKNTVGSAEPKRLQANARALNDYSAWKKLQSVSSPVVIVGAETDKLHGLETLEKMISLIPRASLEILKSNKETHSARAGELIVRSMDTMN